VFLLFVTILVILPVAMLSSNRKQMLVERANICVFTFFGFNSFIITDELN